MKISYHHLIQLQRVITQRVGRAPDIAVTHDPKGLVVEARIAAGATYLNEAVNSLKAAIKERGLK